MLKVNSEQIAFLQKKKRLEFTQKVEQYLLKNHPAHAKVLKDRNDFSSWVKRVVNKAFDAGFSTEQQLFRIINVAVFQGEEYAETPWAQEIFNADLSPNTRSVQLQQASIDQIKNLRKEVQALLKDQRERRITTFCEKNQERLQTLGKYRYNLEFMNEQEELAWLKKAGESAVQAGYKLQAELSLWMDLSMAHGLHFYNNTWAKRILDSQIQPSEKLIQLLDAHNKVQAENASGGIQS